VGGIASPAVPPTTKVKERQLNALAAWLEPFSGAGAGSNSWAVAAARSQSGHALLANDPHLSLKDPPFWHWVHLEFGAGDTASDTIGSSLPGVPVITTGTNRHVSWGLTNAYLDVADVAYLPERELRTVSERPVVWARFFGIQVPVFFKTFEKLEGLGWPVIPIEAPPGRRAVLRWTGFGLKGQDFEGLFELYSVKSAVDADRVLASIGVPTWNFVFADTSGAIGYRAIGNAPAYRSPAPYGLLERSLAEFTSWPMLPVRNQPHLFNPSRGYLATANNRQWGGDSLFHVGRAHDIGFRAFRIEEMLTKASEHSPASLARIQCDLQAVDARFLLPELLGALIGLQETKGVKPREWRAIRYLREWNYETSLDCRACAVYRRWMQRIEADLGLTAAALYRSLKLEGGPALRGSLIKAFSDALNDLKIIDPERIPAWGDVHRALFRHLSGEESLAPLDALPTPGDERTVNPGSLVWNPEGWFEHTAGASERMIFEMSQPPQVFGVLAGPNRGHAAEARLGSNGSPWLSWRDCRQERLDYPLDWSRVGAADVKF
jgi:acyl-homoserine lactone acylase PvdQ